MTKRGLVGAWCPSLGATGFRLLDRSGRGNHGTLTNMAATAWTTSGGKGALSFDGVDDEIQVQHHPSLSFTPSQFITMTSWVRLTTSVGYRTVFTKRIVNNSNYELSFNTSGNQILFYAGGPFNTSTSAVVQGEWSHIACTSGPAGGAYFINGALAGTHANPIGTPNTEPLRYGSANFQQRLTGQLDDGRIYNRALTAPEIRQLYLGGRGFGLLPERPRRRGKAAGAAFKAYWARRQSQLIGGGV